MKLLHVIGSMNPSTGGPCQTIRNGARCFIEQGNTLEVVCLNDPHSDFLGSDDFPVYALGQGRGSWNYHPALLPWLNERSKQYDAIILNGLWQFQGYALWKSSKQPEAPPYYIFPHGMLDPWFQRLSVRPLKALRNSILWKVLMHRIVHDARGLLFTSEEEQRLARLPFRPYAPKQETVVGLGLPDPPEYHDRMVEAFREKCPGLNGTGFFLFLGRIHPKKGVDLLIKAYSALGRSSGASSLPRLVIAGPGLDTPYGKKMQKLAAEICPPNSVSWPGMLTGDAKWGASYNCDAFVLPSHQENFGIAVVEALACGRPVLISDQVNIWREIREHGAALVQSNSVEATSRLLQDWISLSTNDRSTMAAQAKPCFKSCFSIEYATRRLLETISPETKVK
jgi:glycosyltransferase involved in cell wall biosynthesis